MTSIPSALKGNQKLGFPLFWLKERKFFEVPDPHMKRFVGNVRTRDIWFGEF